MFIWLVFPPDYPMAPSRVVDAADAEEAIARVGSGAGSTAQKAKASDVVELHNLIGRLADEVCGLRAKLREQGVQ